MDMKRMMGGRPRIAVIDPNNTSCIRIEEYSTKRTPIMEVETFSSFDDFYTANPDSFFHYFVAQTIVLENRIFFTERRQKTILLTVSKDSNSQLSGFTVYV